MRHPSNTKDPSQLLKSNPVVAVPYAPDVGKTQGASPAAQKSKKNQHLQSGILEAKPLLLL